MRPFAAPQAAVQSLLAFYIWGNPATTKGVLGIFLVLGGSALYTMVQMQGGPAPPPLPTQAPALGQGQATGADKDKEKEREQEREPLLATVEDTNKKTDAVKT